MLEFAAGIAVGSAFAPFWMMLWDKVKPTVFGWIGKTADKTTSKKK